MTVFGPQALIAACTTSAACLIYTLLCFPELRRLLGAPFAALRARRHRIYLAGRRLDLARGDCVASRTRADSAPFPDAKASARSGLSGTGPADTGWLYQIACICNRDDQEVGAVLGNIAELLAASMPRPEASSCRIEFMGSCYWSPGYVAHEARFDHSLQVSGARVGLLTLCSADPESLGEMQSPVDAAAEFVGHMLARRLDRKRLEDQRSELKRRQSILEQTARLAKLGAWEFDVKSSTFTWSDEMRRIVGWEIEGEPEAEREKLIAAFLRKAIQESLRRRTPINRELPCFQPDGKRRWLQTIGEVEFFEAQPVKVIGIVRDITDERETQGRLFNMANHDALTGLPNRRHFLEKLDSALLTRGAAGALLLIDLDNFKDVNDTSGHDVGDALLKAFARRLEETAKGAVVARLGGDEFAMLLPNSPRQQAEHQAHALLSKLREPIVVFGRRESVRLSAGMTYFPADGRDAAALLKNADLATYAAKARGRNSLVTYKKEIREASERRISVCSEVEAALAANQFVPFYQPKICLRSGMLVGFEALLRWEHPNGLRTPGSILPAFNVPELSRGICSRMLDRIVVDLAYWQAQRLPFGRVAFNASAAEFEGFDLANRVLRQLKSIGLSPAALGLEVTETVLLGRDTDAITAALKQLHDAGVEIALDDFGTGYASLTHLQKFPVDVIKIDQSFIRGLISDSGSQAITSVVLGLGHSLGMKVVAEGVETVEQARLLTASGCDQVQGYYFARPMPAADVPAFMMRWRGADEISMLGRKAA